MASDIFDYFHVGLFSLAAAVCVLVALATKSTKVRNVSGGNAIALFASALTYLTLRSFPGRPEYRWLGYTLACTIFAYETAVVQGRRQGRAAIACGLMGLTLFTGFLGHLFSSTDLWLVFALGSLTYVASLLMLALRERGEPKSDHGELHGRVRGWYLAFFIFVWSVYPLVYLLGPAVTGVIRPWAEEVAYFGLEFFAKYAVAAMNILLAGHALDSFEKRRAAAAAVSVHRLDDK